jgi:predicted Zn-dependent peptidase
MIESPAQKTVLDNGIRIITKKIPHLHSVSMGMWVNVGARDETGHQNGISHFIEHMLFKGTRKRTGYQIAKEFDAIGGHTNAFTSMENTCYHAKVMDRRLDLMVDILSDIFVNSLFDQGEIEKERPVIFQEICMVEDNPEEYVHTLSATSYWGDNPLGRSVLGSRENVTRFDSSIIRDFFKGYYQPDRIVISAAGNLEHSRVLDLLAPAFTSIHAKHQFPERYTPAGQAGVAVKHKDLEQVHICLNTRGLSITDPKRYALSLMNTILGGNMSSRLFQKIREKEGLAYSVYSYASSYEDTGMFGAYVGTDAAHCSRVVELILEEMRNLKNKGIEASELHDAKEFTKGSLVLASESVDNQMVRLAQNEFHFGGEIPLEEVLTRIDAVCEADISDLSQSLFQTDHLSLVLLGPVSDPAPYQGVLYC